MGRRVLVVLAAVLAFVLAFVPDAAAASAEASDPAYVRFPSGVGFCVGEISGTGISYRHWFTEKVGLQACAGGLYLPGSYGSNLLMYWTGAELLRSLYATEFTKWLFGQVYLFAGLSHYGYVPWEVVDYETGTYEAGAYVPGFGLGAGVGIEMTLFRHFSLAFELGYAAFWEATGAAFLDGLRVDLVPQGVFQFRF